MKSIRLSFGILVISLALHSQNKALMLNTQKIFGNGAEVKNKTEQKFIFPH